MTSYPKESAFRSERWRRAVASLPCVVCFRDGPSQAAHRNFGKSMGMKTDDCFTAALCQACHSEIDSGAHLSRQERRDRMDAAILMTIRAMAIGGLLHVK